MHGNTLIKAGPDIILNRFSTVNVVPSMLGSPLESHLTAHGCSIRSSARAEQDRNIKANVSDTPNPKP